MSQLQSDTSTVIKKLRHTLKKMYPNVECELNFSTPLELLIAVMLSAQATDVSVNKATPKLFQKYKTVQSYAKANNETLQSYVRTLNLYKTKANNIKKMAQILIDSHNSEVPRTRDELESLPGVGRKTANVVLSVAFGVPAFAVDTHVSRVSWRLGLCKQDEKPNVIEGILTNLVPKKEWSITHHRMIFFGRYFCTARKPQCEKCSLQKICNYYKSIV